MLFYAFKMAVSIASLCVNVSDLICTQPDQTLFFSNLYIDIYTGVLGVSNNQIFLQIKLLSSCPKIEPNIKNRVFRFELFSVHLPLC